MSKPELYYTGGVVPRAEEWEPQYDHGVAPTPWTTAGDGIRDASGRLIFIPALTSVTRGFVSANYENMDAVVRLVGGDQQTNNTLQQLQTEIVKWADDIFPDRTPQTGFLKLFEEIGEALREPTDHHEWADVFIMLLDITRGYGVSGDEIADAVREKMEINRKRQWVKNRLGMMEHVTTQRPPDEPRSYTVGIPYYIVDGPYEGNHTYQKLASATIPDIIEKYDEEAGVTYQHELEPPHMQRSFGGVAVRTYRLTGVVE